MTWETVTQVLVLFAAASGYMWISGREPRQKTIRLSRRGARRLNAKDDPFAVWAAWEQAVGGWVLAHPDDRNARWIHPEDIHPIVMDYLSTPKRRTAWARGADAHALPAVDA